LSGKCSGEQLRIFHREQFIELIFSVKLLYKFNDMKSVKFFLVALCALAFGEVFGQNTISADVVDVTINGQTTREELALLNKEMRAQGLVFNYKPQFDNDRRLLSLQYKVTTTDNTIIGTGGHETLQTAGAKVRFQIAVPTKAFTETKE
jgi:hypothetical protein